MILKTKFYCNFKETQQMIENDIYEERWWYVFVIRIVMNDIKIFQSMKMKYSSIYVTHIITNMKCNSIIHLRRNNYTFLIVTLHPFATKRASAFLIALWDIWLCTVFFLCDIRGQSVLFIFSTSLFVFYWQRHSNVINKLLMN